MNHAGAIHEASDDPLRSFRDWQDACARLRAAETHGGAYSDNVRLSAEVIRTRNALTLDQVHAGWSPPAEIMRHLSLDERLLLEGDDTALSRAPAPAAIPFQLTDAPQV